MRNVMTKLKKSLTNNFGIKITAVIVAAIVWLAVVNVNDPEKTVTIYNIPITMTHEEAITDLGMVYNLESKNSISVTVTGKRSVVGNLSAEDFVATASLAELSKVNVVPVEVTTENPSIARKITIVKQSLNTVKVSVENVETQDFNIEVDFSGKTASGYVAGDYSLSNNTVNVKAPESVLDRIERVAAVCNLDSNSTDMEQKCDIVLYDKRGKIIKSEKIELSVKKVTVYVDVLKEKEVPINITTIGIPADGYHIVDITLSQETVKLIGKDEALADIESLEVSSAINISGHKSDILESIDLSEYLAEGVSINGETVIEVSINIDELKTETYTIDANKINIENLDNDLSAEISDKSVKITLRGEKDVINAIDADDIAVSIDLKNVDKGTSKVSASIEVPEGTELMNDVNVKVKVK